MNSNYHSEIYNCLQDKPCPSGYECCSEKTSPNVKKTYGLCCKEGSCNHRGHCTAPYSSGEDESGVMERYMNFQKETYDERDNCNSWKTALIVMSILCILLFICIIFISFMSKMKS
jgi:hypothetical protein